MRTIQTTVFKFDELSEAAKEKARAWYREGDTDDFDVEFIYEDAATIADLFGLDIRTRNVSRHGGPVRFEPNIYYSGFWSQGDGACFEGTYRYKAGALKAVKNYAPQDAELHAIVTALQAVQKKYFYRLRASCNHRGHYYHSGCMSVDVEYQGDDCRDVSRDDEQEITDQLRLFADWIYDRLEADYDWHNADEQVDDSIIANEYEFTEEGERA